MRNAAVQANVAEVDEVCNEDPALRKEFLSLFAPLVQSQSQSQDSRTDGTGAGFKRRAPSPRSKTKLPRSQLQASGRPQQPTGTGAAENTLPASSSSLEGSAPGPTKERPATTLREVALQPGVPLLKRRRVLSEEESPPPLKPSTAAASHVPTATDPDPVIRDATPEEAAAKRRALQESATNQDIDMDASTDAGTASASDARN